MFNKYHNYIDFDKLDIYFAFSLQIIFNINHKIYFCIFPIFFRKKITRIYPDDLNHRCQKLIKLNQLINDNFIFSIDSHHTK